MHRILLFIIILVLAKVNILHALSVETHMAINIYIAGNIMRDFSLDTYLKYNLGIQAGKDEKYNTYAVWEWLRDGGRYEDEPPWTFPYIRSVNHFHNPIKSLDQAGFTGIWDVPYLLHGKSSILWAQSNPGVQSPGGRYSWHDARKYYYEALTSSGKSVRDSNFADTFRGVGQFMHLVQDMSVPEHARDDGHYIGDFYEEYVNNKLSAGIVDDKAKNAVYFSWSSLLKPSAFADAPVPIANLFDTNQYKGNNPEVTIVTDSTSTKLPPQTIGLAEYTNANFVSTDTIYSAATFTYPIVSDSPSSSVTQTTNNILDPLDSNKTVARKYYWKERHGDTGYLLAGVGYMQLYAKENNIAQGPDVVLTPMDDKVHADYADRLLPRAVGYSAALLNYFFRGDINLEPLSTDPTKYVIKNNTDEEMNGTFRILYDDTEENRIRGNGVRSHMSSSWNL